MAMSPRNIRSAGPGTGPIMTGPIMTGLSGHEMYCLNLKGFTPGEMIIGNSVYSLGFIGSIGAGLQVVFGGEVSQVTSVIADGRRQSQDRLVQEAHRHGADGITGVTSELRTLQGNTEFLSVASAIRHTGDKAGTTMFSTSVNGQELYCLMDAGYEPRQFVFGNVAYSVGLVGGLLGTLKTLARGEIKEFSDIFNRTRHLALDRIASEAAGCGANAVVGIETRIMPFAGTHEMLMTGTAAVHPALPAPEAGAPVTSDLTCEEMWNLAALGFMPLKLVLGTAVYSLGFVGGVKALFKSFVRGEISDLTSLVYDAREHAIGLLRDEAAAIGADDVVGIKTHIHDVGGVIEFMAIGTAVKRIPGAKPLSDMLPVQAIIKDRRTWFSHTDIFSQQAGNHSDAGHGDGGGSGGE
jgi:uncharacterized protein YbjQ (UPF0145 family)